MRNRLFNHAPRQVASRRVGLVMVTAILACILALVGGASAPAASYSREAVIDSRLLDQLAQNPNGEVAAVVTAWNRAELAGIDEVVEGTTLRVLPMVLTQSLTRAELESLADMPGVRSVYANRQYRTFMEDSTWITRARYVWGTSNGSGGLAGFGVTGQGVEIAVIDTGIDGMHEDADNLIEFCDATAAATGDRTTVLCSPWDLDFNPGPAGPCGALEAGFPTGPCTETGLPSARTDSTDADVSHGTHVSGTVAGSGDASGGRAFTHSTIGMAPDAKLRVYSANIATALITFQTLASYDDMTYKKEQGYNNVVAVSNSWGGGDGANYDASDPISVAVKRAYDAGIVSVFAAGNSGPEHDTLSAQCVIPYVVCVAASTKPDSVAMFSSRGRPSQPTDTNRDGTIDAADVQPDNHDRTLGQKLEKGLYRPTVAAPGVAINSMKAIGANIGDPQSALCREEPGETEPPNAFCYVQLMGTSMATPHVSGTIALIVQGYRQGHNGNTPTPAQITDILERSANTSKLPAWDSEEQGAGRIDAYEAVRFARTYPNGLRRPNLGYPTPPYVQGQYPGSNSPATTSNFAGCTGAGSWTARGVAPLPLPVEEPPLSTQRYGQHFINVPEKTDRIRVTIEWPNHPTANLYARLWRPGVNPDAESATPDQAGRSPAYHQTRVFPDQEATGLPVGAPPTYRLVEVRSPEHASTLEGGEPPAIPSGQWVLRVYHRAGGAPLLCGTTQETPPLAERIAYEYDVKVELPRVTHQPSVRIDAPAEGSTTGSRWVEIRGRAGYPPHALDPPPIGNHGHSWEGVTNWEVPGSTQAVGTGDEDPDPNNPRPILYMHGNTEEGCTGQGKADVAACNGPFLLEKTQLSTSPAAFWRTGIDDAALDGAGDRTVYDPNWSWCLTPGPGCAAVGGDTPLPGPVTVGGPMTVKWWASCTACDADVGLSADWIIRVWADGVLKIEQRVTATPADPLVPSLLTKTVTLPTFTANQRIVVHIDPVYVDSQTVTNIYYDSVNDCLIPIVPGPCDSRVHMPVGASGGGGGGGAAVPENVRVTDLPANAPYPAAPEVPALRVAWDDQGAGVAYEVYRSTDPLDLGRRVFHGTGTVCTSPEAPAPEPADAEPGHDRPGRCYTDRAVALRTTYYYRVVAVEDGQESIPSEIAYGTPTKYDRQVKLKVDRLYGPQYWEYALDEPSPNPTKDDVGLDWRYRWDTLELFPGPHAIFARSFTQGIGSRKDQQNVIIDGNGGSTPNCEVRITNGGWITAANGDRGSFGGNATSDAFGVARGQEEYQDHGPATDLNVHSILIERITCFNGRTEAEIEGQARVDGQGVHKFRIRVRDAGEPGNLDRYQLRLEGPAIYDSGFQLLQGGNIQIH